MTDHFESPIDPPQSGEGQADGSLMLPDSSVPTSITTAVWLLRITAALTLAWIVIELAGGILSKEAILDGIRLSDPDTSSNEIDALYRTIVFLSLGLGILGAAFWLWMAWKARQGRGWVRIFVAIVVVINAPSLLLWMFSPASTEPGLIVRTLLAGCMVYALISLFRRSSSTYFIAMSIKRYMAAS